MRIINFILIALMGLSTVAHAQLDRSKRPEAGPAPEIQLGEAQSFTLDNGLKVFVIENDKLPRISFSLRLDVDPVLEGDKAGLSDMIGEMMTAGTTNRDKDTFNEEIDFMGARVSAGSTSMFASSLTRHRDKVLDLMTDALYNPLFPEEELDKLKTQAKSGLALATNDPSAISSMVSARLNFGDNHPYGEPETEETYDNITVDDVRAYHNTFFKPNVAYLAIVGDISFDDAKALVTKYFSAWERGDVPGKVYEVPQPPKENMVALVDKASANQSVLNLTYPVDMSLDNEDYLTTRVLNQILGSGGSSRLFMNLREDKGYTYGAYSRFGSDKLIASFSVGSSVGGHVTDSAIYEMLYELNKIVDEGVTEDELASAKANIGGSFARSLENPGTIANFAINTKRYGLNDDFYRTYLQRLNAITIEDVHAAAKKYIKPNNMHITVVGNASEIKEKLEAFGPVTMYSPMGDPVKTIEIEDADITPDIIIMKYLDAIGGIDLVQNVKNAEIEMSADIQGQTMNMKMIYDVENGGFVNEVSMMGNVMQRMVIYDGQGKVSSMGQVQELAEEDLKKGELDTYVFPELYYNKLGYTLTLDGIREVKGENAYKIVVSNEDGPVSSEYYSVETGLKVKSENPMAGDSFMSDYEEVSGVLFPMSMELNSPQIPFPLKSKVESIEFNKELPADTFE